MQRSLQAQVRDPLWFLARQWQMGEFLGDDAGSPIQATMGVEQRSITTYRPGPDDAKTTALGSHDAGGNPRGARGCALADARLRPLRTVL
jgi:hypothetical protein